MCRTPRSTVVASAVVPIGARNIRSPGATRMSPHCLGLFRLPIGCRTRAHSTRLKRTLNVLAIVPRPERSGDLAKALQLIGAKVELDRSGRVQGGLLT